MKGKKIIALTICMFMLFTGAAYAVEPQGLDAPTNLTIEQKQQANGAPYFVLKFKVPQSALDWAGNAEDDERVDCAVDCKVGNGLWYTEDYGAKWSDVYKLPVDELDSSNPVYTFTQEPIDEGGTGSDIKINSAVYQFRVRLHYAFYDSEGEWNEYEVFTPWSSVVSTGIQSFYDKSNASSWAIAELDKAAEYGFITDRIKNKMNGPITREEFCEVVVKLYEKMTGNTATYSANPFTDTNNPEILKAYELGIVKGVGNNRFAPNDLITREQLSAMMYRSIKVCRPDADFTTGNVGSFRDQNMISGWALESVQFMYKNGIIKGSGNGTIDPKATTTREQAVLLAVRSFEKFMAR